VDRIQNMRAFLRVVESGSFTAAAQSLNTSTGVISRAVSELEARLRIRLLNRSTRRLSVTDAGQRYMTRCRQILEDIDNAEAEATNAHDRPAGVLRMHSYASIGQHYVLPAISRYRKQYPEVNVELTLLQRSPDLFEGSSDVSVVAAPSLPDSDLVSHHIGTTFNVLCASPEYVQANGMPSVPSDLLHHSCLILHTPAFPTHVWTLEGPEGKEVIEVSGPVQTNIAESLLVAAHEGMGIATVPIYAAIQGLKDGSLVRVLPDHILQRMNIYAIYASRRYIDAKIRTWIAFLRSSLPEAMARDEKTLLEIAGRGSAETYVQQSREESGSALSSVRH
jgi:DNA-binding transcriptional LysR family regulator